MEFTETKLAGAFILDVERQEDPRGFFARVFCVHELEAKGLNARVVQCSISFSRRKGTIRGMHWQEPPMAEVKVIRCTRGALLDVIVDLRPGSPTRLQHISVELSENNGRMLYIPEGFAHGFQTLADETEALYQMTQFFAPECARGARWNDPGFGIHWPLPEPILNERDRSWPDFH